MIGSSAAKWAAEMSPDGGVLLVGEGEDGLYRAWSDEGRITRVFDLNPNWRELAAESIKRYKDIEKESGIMFFHEVGYLTLVDENYPNPKKLTETAEELNNTGYTCKKVAGKQGAASSFPYLDLLPGVWGFSQPDKAGHLSPRALVAAQQKLAEAKGCEILRQSVVGLEKAAEGHFVLELSSGKSISSQKVILATGAYLNLSNHLKPFTSKEVNLRLTTQTVKDLVLLTSTNCWFRWPTSAYQMRRHKGFLRCQASRRTTQAGCWTAPTFFHQSSILMARSTSNWAMATILKLTSTQLRNWTLGTATATAILTLSRASPPSSRP